jgi:hypothetical protein
MTPRRVQELAALWRSEQPTRDEVQRAYWRFTSARREPARPFRVGRWLLVGALIGVGAASAAPGGALHHLALELTGVVPDRGTQNPRSLRPKPSIRTERAPSARLPTVEATPAAAETPSQPPREQASRGVGVSRTAPPKSAVVKATGEPPSRTEESAEWQRAARALRARDFREAEAALESLEKTGAQPDREAARLSRAQLLLANGRLREAQAALRSLATSAVSPRIRASALELERSVSEPPATNQP